MDALRGLIMLLMALDHVRDFFSGARFLPLDLAHTTPALFMTRWVTHLCAPGFVLLAGTSAYLWVERGGKTRPKLARFLLMRGLWLILLELTLVHLAWFLTLDYEVLMLQVIWVIGLSMIVLAGMVFLPDGWILALAVSMIAGHNLLDRFVPVSGDLARGLWDILHRPALMPLGGGHFLYVLYPLIPWPGVMALGYLLGKCLRSDAQPRSRKLMALGGSLALAFVLLRFLNLYGDPAHWFRQRNALFTFLSFINLEKYPPSLLFLLVTLGVNLFLLGLLDRLRGAWLGVLVVFGRVPLFYYIAHLFVIHLAALGLAYLKHGRADWLTGSAWFFREGYPPDYGYSLPVVYLIWALVVVILYPVCKFFAGVKSRSRAGWLSYI